MSCLIIPFNAPRWHTVVIENLNPSNITNTANVVLSNNTGINASHKKANAAIADHKIDEIVRVGGNIAWNNQKLKIDYMPNVG